MTKQADHMETVNLEPGDIKKLRMQMIPAMIFPVAAIAIFYFIFNFVLNGMGNSFEEGGLFKIIFFVFGVFFFGIIGYMIWTFFADLKNGVKHRITGEVTDKNLHIQRSSNVNSSTRRTGSSKTSRYYYVFIDGVKYKVDLKTYNNVTVGDTIRMDRAPKSGLTLDMQILEEAVTEETVKKQEVDLSFLQSKIEPQQMNQQDLDVLKKLMMRQVSRSLIWSLPFLFMVYPLISSGLSGLLIIFFPIVIIPAYQFYKAANAAVTYFRNKTNGTKLGETAIVTDKRTVTSNRAGDKYQLGTSIGNISVTPEAYQQLGNDDKIIVWKPAVGREKISIVTMDKQEFYLT